MHNLIEQDVQKMGFFVYDNLEPEEIDLKINESIYAFIEAVLDITKGKQPKIGLEDGFQVNQVSLDSLRTIHVKAAERTVATDSDGFFFLVPENYLHYIKAKLTVTYLCNELNNKNVRVQVTKTLSPPPALRIGDTQVIDNMRRSAFHKTRKDSPLGEIADTQIYIYGDGIFTVTTAFLDYIRKPAKVSFADPVHCDLPDSVQYMIKDIAVNKILKVIEAPQQKVVNLDN